MRGVTHPGVRATGLRSPYLRGQPVAAQRRATVRARAQCGTRLRALGGGPTSLQGADADPQRHWFGGRGLTVGQHPRPLLAFLRSLSVWAFPPGLVCCVGEADSRFFLPPTASSMQWGARTTKLEESLVVCPQVERSVTVAATAFLQASWSCRYAVQRLPTAFAPSPAEGEPRRA